MDIDTALPAIAVIPTLNSRCPGCRAILSETVDVAGERYCRECATEMLRDMAEAMKR